MVGKRVAVRWGKGLGLWFEATVLVYNKADGRHILSYDFNDEVDVLNIDDYDVKMISTPNPKGCMISPPIPLKAEQCEVNQVQAT